jgi:hypothetical protein
MKLSLVRIEQRRQVTRPETIGQILSDFGGRAIPFFLDGSPWMYFLDSAHRLFPSQRP